MQTSAWTCGSQLDINSLPVGVYQVQNEHFVLTIKLGIAHHEILLQFLACTGSSISVVIVQVGNMRTGMLSMVSSSFHNCSSHWLNILLLCFAGQTTWFITFPYAVIVCHFVSFVWTHGKHTYTWICYCRKCMWDFHLATPSNLFFNFIPSTMFILPNG